MIQTRDDLKYYIKRDRARYPISKARYYLGMLTYGGAYHAIRYLKTLRYCEYHTNNKGFYHNIMAKYYYLKLKRLGNKYGVCVGVNECGPGIKLAHLCGGIIISAKKVGENININTGCVIGKKKDGANPTIGNNVKIFPGAKVIGDIVIGDNVIIAPNSVVIKDVPSNCVVSGVPAVIIKRMEPRKS